MMYDRVMTVLVQCFPFEGVAIGDAGPVVLSWWCLYCY
jgi:hypothetical protein